MTDLRALVLELADALEQLHKQSVTAPHTQFVELSNGRHPIPLGTDVLTQDLMVNDLLDRARAALAEEAVGPSDELITSLEQELERERIRLAACGVIAMADTPESAAEARKIDPYYHSASLDDVIRQVDALMAARSEAAEAAAAAAAKASRGQGDDAKDPERIAWTLRHVLRPSDDGEYDYWMRVLNAAAASGSEQIREAFFDWHGRCHHSKTQQRVAQRYERSGKKSEAGLILKLAKEQQGVTSSNAFLPPELRYGGGACLG